MLDERRKDVYRFAFAAGAGADVAFGAWTAAFAAMSLPPKGAAGWALYGWTLWRVVASLVAARCVDNPERARPEAAFLVLVRIVNLVALGLLPITNGVSTVLQSVPMTVEVALLVPLALFLAEGRRFASPLRASAPLFAGAIHAVAALFMLLVISPAADPGISLHDRHAWFATHVVLWRAGWISWMLGAVSLLAFYAWWGTHLAARTAARAAFGLACLGACFDLSCEAYLVAANRSTVDEALRTAGFWTTVFANGFYCIAGVILTVATPGLPRWLKSWSWAIWIAGFGMSAAGGSNWLPGIKISTAVLTVLLVPWFVVLGRFLSKRAVPA